MSNKNSDISEVVLALNEVHGNSNNKSHYFPHPVAAACHILFRSAALLTYLFCGWFSNSFIASFLIVILLISMDFWTVKNITGRLLVGMRWWNHVDEQGHSHWVYESLAPEERNRLSASEKRLFWGALWITEGLWIFFLIASIFTLSLKWIMVVLVCLTMNSANIMGYLRCRIGGQRELTSVAKDFLSQQIVGSVLSSWKSQQSQSGSTGRNAPTRPDFPSSGKN